MHKIVRYLRAHHSRTTNRKDGLNDMFKGLLESSDPVIAFLRKKPKPKGLIDPEVLKMLVSYDPSGSTPPLHYLMESDDENDVDDRFVLQNIHSFTNVCLHTKSYL